MTRSTLKPWIAATVIALGAMTAPAVRATSEDERPGEIGILTGVGFGDQDLVGTDNKDHANAMVGGRFAWHFTDIVAGYFEMTWVSYKGDPALFGNVGEYSYLVGPEWYVNHKDPWQFFINLGVGGVQYQTRFGGDDGRGELALGLGVRRGWQHGALRMELRTDHTVTSAEGLGGGDFTTLKGIAGWTWGVGARPKDTDGDGVFDKKDKCPDTPHGAIVDKVGCPIDSDGDGVWDGIDQCPDTPKGWPVDAKGCPLDSDGDGVVDGKDKCPNTPKGCTVNADGCPADADGDGVCDGVDKCPNTPKGCRVDASGCPIDSDGDGVCDGIDQCPGTPSGVKVDAKGCPPPPPPPPAPAFIPEPKKELVLDKVYFETDSAKLKPESATTLDKVAESLIANPDIKIQVAGHTDNTGSAKHNLKLSDQRAAAVMNYLISKGVNPANLSEHGYGMTEPVADNKTPEGRAQNRRVGLRREN
jgi:outer membrane protein OmpA-like peptidoglycan-associated protein